MNNGLLMDKSEEVSALPVGYLMAISTFVFQKRAWHLENESKCHHAQYPALKAIFEQKDSFALHWSNVTPGLFSQTVQEINLSWFNKGPTLLW